MNKKSLESEKNRVLSHYGGGKPVCVRCGFCDARALSIDHIDGNAKEKIHGERLYQWLVDNKFPVGYQTLCMNCQWIKRVENSECAINKRMTSEQRYEAFRKKFGEGRERALTHVTRKKILKWVNIRSGEFKISELIWEFGLKEKEMPNIYVYLNRLVFSGELERIEQGHYKLKKKPIGRVRVFNP